MILFLWFKYNFNILGIRVIENTMISQFAKKLHSQKTVKRHEEDEKQSHVINLLTWTPVKV